MAQSQDPRPKRKSNESVDREVDREAPSASTQNPESKISGEVGSIEQPSSRLTPDHASAERGFDASSDVRTVVSSDETGHN